MAVSIERRSKSVLWRCCEIMTALLSLSCGGVIYLFFRPYNLLLFRVLDGMGCLSAVNQWRSMVPKAADMPEFLVYSLPNALWVIAYLLITDVVMHRRTASEKMAWASLIPATGTFTELLQGIRLLPGTFDWADLLCYMLPWIAYMFMVRQYDKQQNERTTNRQPLQQS